jgi:hypothetical protein
MNRIYLNSFDGDGKSDILIQQMDNDKHLRKILSFE